MASLRQVAQAIAELAATACYPSGTGAASITGTTIRTSADDPRSVQLNTDLAAGGVNVRVLPRQGVGRSIPVSLMGEQEVVNSAPTLTATVAGNVVTFAGTVTATWPVLLTVNGTVYTFTPGVSDTPSTVAAGLAALVSGASATGPALTIPGAHALAVQFSTLGSTALPLIRQTQGFQITVFAPGPNVRETVGQAIKLAIVQSPRLLLPDGTLGLLRFTSEWDENRPSKELDFERRMLCQVEYDTVVINSTTAWQIGANVENVTLRTTLS